MPSYRWSYLIAALCGVGGASWGTVTSAYQFAPLGDDIIDVRHIHQPDAWVGGGFQSSGAINQSPAEFGPALGMLPRSPSGYPASGDSFPMMTAGPLPGGLSPDGFNGSGMRPPVNQPAYIANNPLFGGNGQSPNGQSPFGQTPAGQMPFGMNGPIDPSQFNPNGPMPSGASSAGQNGAGWNSAGTPFGPAPQMTNATRIKPKVSWALDAAQQPYVGLLGQVARPGVYEIERRGTLLSDLLQSIGGLAKDASGQFRIIRNGRPGQATSYAGAAQFELMAGDLIIADAQPSQYGQRPTDAKQSVQIGFVNLLDRPVVLKLRSEDAKVSRILSIMGQDQGLAAQIKIVIPSGQRGNSQPGADAVLVSETVLIFPPSSVKTERLAALPEPYRLKREADTPTPSRDTTSPYAPRGAISPDVNQPPRSQPSVGTWSDSTPLPQTSQPVSRPSIEPSPVDTEIPPPPSEELTAPKRTSGVRGTPRRTTPEHSGRDSELPHAPPAEGPTPSPREVPTTDATHDSAPAPELNDSTPFDMAEPSLLNAKGKKRHIHLAKDDESNDPILTSADLDEAEAAAHKTGSSWSIWPPILTAGVGLLALIGFSLSLRRRTQVTAQHSTEPMTQTRPTPPAIRTPQSVQRRELLDEIIDDQLPLTQEQVPLASPMQFHGRPQPPKSIRMDQRHPLPRPHSPNTAAIRGQGSEINDPTQVAEPVKAAGLRPTKTATQTFRIDRTGATGSGTKIVPATTTKTSSSQPSVGSLDRALSAVQKQALQKREERDA